MKSRPGARTHIRTLTGRDQAAIKAIGRVGISSKEQLMTNCNLTHERLTKLCKSNYLESHADFVHEHGFITTYKLGKEADRWLRNEQAWDYVRYSKSSEIEHDVKLARMYFDVPEQLKGYWVPDKHARQLLDLGDAPGRNSMPDAVLLVPVAFAKQHFKFTETISNTEYYTIAIEAVGRSYSQQLIEEKATFAYTHFDHYVCE